MSLDFDLPIGLSPMADSDNINNSLSVIYTVNNPVVANSDAPQVLFALQIARSGRPWVLGKTVDPMYHPPYDGSFERLQLPASRTRKSDHIISHQKAICRAGAVSALRIQAFRVARPGADAPR